MRGLSIVIGILATIWCIAFGWIVWQIAGKSAYCVDEICYSLIGLGSKLNFAAMNALVLTYSLAPIVVTFALIPLLWVVTIRVWRLFRHRYKTNNTK